MRIPRRCDACGRRFSVTWKQYRETHRPYSSRRCGACSVGNLAESGPFLKLYKERLALEVRAWLRRAPAWRPGLLDEERQRYNDRLERLRLSDDPHALSARAYSVPPWTDARDVEEVVDVLVRLLTGQDRLAWRGLDEQIEDHNTVTVRLANGVGALPDRHTDVLRLVQKRSHGDRGAVTAKVSTGSVYRTADGAIRVVWTYQHTRFQQRDVATRPSPGDDTPSGGIQLAWLRGT